MPMKRSASQATISSDDWALYGQQYQAWAATQVSASLEMFLSAMEDGEKSARSGEQSYDFPARQPRRSVVPSSVGPSLNFPARRGSRCSTTSFASDSYQSSLDQSAAIERRLGTVMGTPVVTSKPVKRKSRSARILSRLKKLLF
eukprot:CAMPEP_0198211938 /NCGR_PEP_ID=MMETSP1445-20131203/25432_1 /TAXON_ID=36898 /ORGANISM="Pyramimonas sp., Strain CCMP2087" /LENGTH=143 /DNA_ID=CAMNT_0043886299 /DNA_START=179 /DNA_END=610 /DNA_ORIENTATION=+